MPCCPQLLVGRGGSLWVGFRSDLKDHRTNRMRRAPSRLAQMAGVVVEEIESLNTLPGGAPNTVGLRCR